MLSFYYYYSFYYLVLILNSKHNITIFICYYKFWGLLLSVIITITIGYIITFILNDISADNLIL